jgi:Tfp pilus assembly protein PilN
MRAVNLIPSEQRRTKPSGKGSGAAYAVVGVLTVFLVMAVAYVLTSNKVNENETKAAEAKQEADALEAQAAQLGSFTNFAAIKEQRLASVVTTAQMRFDWERLMREVALIMPEGSWLRTTEASVIGDPNAAASAATSATPTVGISPAATFVGCTRKQSEVATLMVRMRQMHRVTDVKLNQSAQEQAESEASIDSCGTLYQFDVTVSFEPVAPANEAPRGSMRVPASLGGGS